MPLKLLVFGRTGRIGSALAALNGPDLSVTALGRAEADLCDPDACVRAVTAGRADVVVNAACHAGTDEITAMAVNARAPGAIAGAACRRRLPLIHLSTDRVFPGTGSRPWRETDPPAPPDVCGATRRLGEQAVLGAHPGAVILRTSWIFSARAGTLVRGLPGAAGRRHRPTVADDRIGCPTPAADIAGAIIWIARALAVQAGPPGVYHYCGTPSVSRHGFARAILARTRMADPAPLAVAAADRAAPAGRPRSAVLDCTLIRRTYGIRQPDWRRALVDLVAVLESEAA